MAQPSFRRSTTLEAMTRSDEQPFTLEMFMPGYVELARNRELLKIKVELSIKCY